ncbi:hypothetical protein TNCV_2839131 [Trichonephila clavipes]|nr:hypothetical protein TNCV_2839131 [Trichonephila clavipes]
MNFKEFQLEQFKARVNIFPQELHFLALTEVGNTIPVHRRHQLFRDMLMKHTHHIPAHFITGSDFLMQPRKRKTITNQMFRFRNPYPFSRL